MKGCKSEWKNHFCAFCQQWDKADLDTPINAPCPGCEEERRKEIAAMQQEAVRTQDRQRGLRV